MKSLKQKLGADLEAQIMGVNMGPSTMMDKAYEYANPPVRMPPMNPLTVTDIERLAKAGVQMDWREIGPYVCPDPKAVQPPLCDSSHLIKPLVERWRRAQARDIDMAMEYLPFHLSACQRGETVYLWVVPAEGEPQVLEDTAQLYPSDMLIAKMFLMINTGNGKLNRGGMGVGQGVADSASRPQRIEPRPQRLQT